MMTPVLLALRWVVTGSAMSERRCERRICYDSLYMFKGTPSARQAVRPWPSSGAETREHRGIARAAREPVQCRAGRRAPRRLRGGRPAAPCRAGALGARRRHQVSTPAPAGRQFRRNATQVHATAKTGRTVLLAPGILSPGKDHRLGRAQGRVPATRGQTLDGDLPGKTRRLSEDGPLSPRPTLAVTFYGKTRHLSEDQSIPTVVGVARYHASDAGKAHGS